jgi:nucleolar GTP-binding protein
MNLKELKKVETADFYIDIAFRKATKAADKLRGRKKKQSRIGKSKEIELAKLSAIKNVLNDRLNEIVTSFPSLNNMPNFYEELIRVTIDYNYLKKSLGAVNWARKKVSEFYSRYSQKIKSTKELETINKHRREFYGRVSSAVKQIKENLKFLDQARKTMLGYPTIKTEIKTIAIAGFPNVGKTTLLLKTTGSKAEIKSYAFTTKGVNVGYKIKDKEKIQYLDTPGTLNRFEKMNNIEKIAFLALKYVADEIIYVFDLTEPYPLEDQLKLYKRLKELKKPVKIFFSKQDLLKKSEIEEFKKKNKL